ncbi:MAG: GNAT family N-acetyltransferase [Syntrophobacterales bacterium]|nr:MAG: GNAT family N-acetyltransferase [Syntrophobacterales bacterium]
MEYSNMEMKPSIEPMKAGDEPAVLALLTAAGLPVEDLGAADFEHFQVARRPDGTVVGAVGLEIQGSSGLLRALVMSPDYRGRGLGRRLVESLEAAAQHREIEILYLLTTTAPDFFPKLGYHVIPRTEVPPAIAATTEFKSLCPDTAVCLCRQLSGT